jgi:integrase
VRQRNRSGSVVLDKRIKTWNFFFWEKGGTMNQFPTKASAWRAAKPLRDAIENQISLNNTTPTVTRLVEQYRAEKMPKRLMTRQGYNTWLNHYIVPRWGNCILHELQARPLDLWLQSLNLAPKSKVHIRGLVRVLWDFAMWRGDVPLQRNPMELVACRSEFVST